MEDAQRTESIKNMVESVDKGNIVLPEFQRDFVWDIAKTYDLFDSLVRDVFIGSLIYGIPSFEITVREIDTRFRKQKGKRRSSLKTHDITKDQISEKVVVDNLRLILDGQQRLTSLYRAFKGIDKVWFIAKLEHELDPDVVTLPIEERSLDTVIAGFSGQADPKRLSINIANVWDIIQGEIKRESAKQKLFEETEYGTLIKQTEPEKFEDLFELYLVLLGQLEDLFKAEKLISYYILDTTQEKFALFFERSNSRGVRLNFVDILTAKLYGGFKLRNKTNAFEDEYSSIKLNLQIVVRCIAYIVSGGKRVAQSYILQNLMADHFNEHWETICLLYKKTFDWLYDNNFILSQSWMPYENMLIPLIMFLRDLSGQDFSQMTEQQRKFITYWYWASIFSQRYSSSSNEIIIQDSNILKQIAVKGKITDRAYLNLFKLQVTSIDDILSLVKKQSAIYKGILNLLNYEVGGLIDWQNTSKLSFNSSLEDHHIFPVGFLRTKYKDDEEILEYIDCVANRTLIPKLTNIKIGKKAPSIYLKDLKTKNIDIVHSLKNHLIPNPDDFIDGLYDDFYSDFLKERAEAFYQLVEKHILSLQKPVEQMYLIRAKGFDVLSTDNKITTNDDPTGKKVAGFSFLEKNYDADSWRTVLLKMCQILNKMQDNFTNQVVKLRGTKRHYISYNPDDLRNPIQIPDTNLWLETNLSAQHTMSVIVKMLTLFGYERSVFSVYRD